MVFSDFNFSYFDMHTVVFLVWISLVTEDLEHFFICLLAIPVSFMKCFFFCLFEKLDSFLFFFFTESCKHSLYILGTSPLSDVWYVIIFFCGLSFHLMVSFEAQNFWSSLIYPFFLFHLCFWCHLRNFSNTESQKIYILFF